MVNNMENVNQNEDFEYIKEKMKQRPLNRKKLMRRTVITASMAVIFGVLACFTFLVLQPVFSNLMNPQEEPEAIEIPEDTNEMLPEDMILNDNKPNQIIINRSEQFDPVSAYGELYNEVARIAQETSQSIVTVKGVSQDVDWFNDEYENTGQTSGLFVASNSRELLILVDSAIISTAEEINVTFCDGSVFPATLKESDINTGLSIIAVPIDEIGEETMNAISIANLGNSRVSTLVGEPVIAIGRPYANTESVAFGMLTAKNKYVNLSDSNYEILMTDIYGSASATGIIVDIEGNVLGIIEHAYNPEDTPNLICALGISDIKKTIERMSNGRPRAYLGVTGTDVTKEANETLGVPYGAYVTGIDMGSPAMNCGIQSGDVIIQLGNTPVTSFRELTDTLISLNPESSVSVTISRAKGDEYTQVVLELTLETQKK